MNDERKHRAEFGDWQTPDELAAAAIIKLISLGIVPNVVIEPTCGVGAFVPGRHCGIPECQNHSRVRVNSAYLDKLKERLVSRSQTAHVQVYEADFFAHDWEASRGVKGSLLVIEISLG